MIAAAKRFGTRGVGIDLDPQRVAEARQKAKEEGVSHLVEFRAEDGLPPGRYYLLKTGVRLIIGSHKGFTTKGYAE